MLGHSSISATPIATSLFNPNVSGVCHNFPIPLSILFLNSELSCGTLLYQSDLPKLDLVEVSQLNFLKPDLKKFPGLNFGWHALNEPNYFSIILNASNEISVDLFLKKRIKFTSIVEIIDKCLNLIRSNKNAFPIGRNHRL